jgi:hypothetical protein
MIMAARPVNAILPISQRRRVTLWFHTSRWVPSSSSRAISGAPQNAPMTTGISPSPAARNSSVFR